MWFIIFSGGVYYGYLLYTPILHNWFYHPVVHDVEKTDFYVKELPFPAVTICSNNKIVKRQLQSVLLTQLWKGYNKKIENFAQDFESAWTMINFDHPNNFMLLTVLSVILPTFSNSYFMLNHRI